MKFKKSLVKNLNKVKENIDTFYKCTKVLVYIFIPYKFLQIDNKKRKSKDRTIFIEKTNRKVED